MVVTCHSKATHVELRFGSGHYFHCVVQGKGIKDRFEVMIAIFPAAGNV